MKLKNICPAGVDGVYRNKESTVLRVNMETGKISTDDGQIEIEGKQNDDETLRNEKNSLWQESSTRLLQIVKSENSTYGFDLTRTKWDPYPWVSNVDADTPAEMFGLKVGDCVLEVNGKDVLGLRITEIAKLVRAKSENVTLLLWSAGHESKCESLCDGPMPRTLQRLSIIVQSILSIIECPVCLDTIPPPAMQCQNGHLLCVNCRIRAEKCPVCRDRYTPRRALIAEQIYASITNAFNLCRTEDKLRQKLFGTNVKHIQQEQQQQQQQEKCEQQKSIVNIGTISVDKEANPRALESKMKNPYRSDSEAHKSVSSNKVRIGLQLPTNKFLTKLLLRKACSMDNLSSATTTPTTTTTTAQAQSTNSNGRLLSCPATPSTLSVSNSHTNSLRTTTNVTLKDKAQSIVEISNDMTTQQIKSFSNQLNNLTATMTSTVTPKTKDCTTLVPKIKEQNTDYLDGPTTTNKITKVNEMSKNFSLSTNDLLVEERHSRTSNSQVNSTGSDGFIIGTKFRPQCTLNPKDLLEITHSQEQTIEPPSKAQKHTSSSISNSSKCNDSDESFHLTASSVDDSSLPSSLQIALPTTTTTMKPSLHTISCSESPTLFQLTSETGSSTIDDFLSASTPSTASSS